MLENFVSAENPPNEPGAKITSADIRAAHGRGLRHLLEHFRLSRHESEGFFSVPVTSRLLESALTLHLLRRTGRDSAWQRRLQDYLHAELEGADTISALAAKAVLNIPLDMDAALAARSFANHAEYGLRRKRALLTMLLVELGTVPFRSVEILPEEYGDGAVHRFSQIYAAALRLMHNRFQPFKGALEHDHAFLANAQSPNGSWEQQALITLVVLLAIGPDHPAFERGFNYLQGLRREDGGVPFIDNQDNWVSCIAGLALQAAGHTEDRLALFIANQQHRNGGWSFADGVTQTDADVSANATQVLLQRKDTRYYSNIRRGLEYLGELQRADGGYPTYEREGESEATMTANILLAQSLAVLHGMDVSSHKMRSAADYLADRQHRDGSFEMSWSRSETYSIFRVLWALNVYSQTEPGWHDLSLTRRSLHHLIQTQHPDGGWGQSSMLSSDALSTAYAVAALCLLGQQRFMESQRINRAVAYLLSQQDQESGAFESVPDVAGPRPIPFKTPLLSTIWCLLALSFVEPGISSVSERRAVDA